MQPGTRVAKAAVRVARGAPAPAECPDTMVLVEGDYCPEVAHVCKRWADPPGRYQHFRCLEYEEPARCVSKERVHLRFCIDRREYTEKGATLPLNHASFSDAKKLCAAGGKRVCLESEWQLACEGEEMRPYPYGFHRDSKACHADVSDLTGKDGRLRDQRARSGAYPRCESPYGVLDLAGNLEEFVARDSNHSLPAMKGAYWQPGRNHCRAAQTAHDAHYNGVETGFRCCGEPTGP